MIIRQYVDRDRERVEEICEITDNSHLERNLLLTLVLDTSHFKTSIREVQLTVLHYVSTVREDLSDELLTGCVNLNEQRI